VLVAVLAAAPARAASHDIQVLSSQQLDSRLTELTLSTAALQQPTHVRVLLPDGYGTSTKRYPVLYLLHGALADYRSWTDAGNAEAITAGAPLIVVMPDGGQGGWYTNWLNRGAGGPPEWERFHIDELVPWIDDHYRTIAARDGRAMAGLSMGGFGAMSYAGRHPDLFDWAGSFSGAVDVIHNLPVVGVIALEALADGGLPDDQFGDRVLNEANWRAHDPCDLAPNLRGMTPRHPAHLGRLRPGHALLALLAARSAPGAAVDPGDPAATRFRGCNRACRALRAMGDLSITGHGRVARDPAAYRKRSKRQMTLFAWEMETG
jgi:S-formylglutathione hydrolase FrmB